MRLVYTPIREWCLLDRSVYRTYGIRCFRTYGGRQNLICVFHDVTPDPLLAVRLAHLCTREQVELCHFRDIVYDYTDCSPLRMP